LRYVVSTPKTDTETDTALFYLIKFAWLSANPIIYA